MIVPGGDECGTFFNSPLSMNMVAAIVPGAIGL
jgi:hypothetical protein